MFARKATTTEVMILVSTCEKIDQMLTTFIDLVFKERLGHLAPMAQKMADDFRPAWNNIQAGINCNQHFKKKEVTEAMAMCAAINQCIQEAI